jgi:2-isopropylmalate synthase
VSTTINYPLLCETSEIVSEATGMAVQANKAIVGRNAFLHESGVHVDGFLKHRATYECLDPASVGFNGDVLDYVVLGKHSGRASYRSVMSSWGHKFETQEQFSEAFARFQSLIQSLPNPTRSQIEATATQQRLAGEDNLVREGPIKIVELLGDGIR